MTRFYLGALLVIFASIQAGCGNAATSAGAPPASPTPAPGPSLAAALTGRDVRGLAFAPDGASGWAVGSGGLVLHYTAGTWTARPAPPAATLLAVAVAPGGEAWAVGGSTILHYAGGVWAAEPNPAAGELRAVLVAPDGTAWAGGLDFRLGVGASAVLLHRVGGTWQPVPNTLPAGINRLAVGPDGTLWAAGEDGLLARQSGAAWQADATVQAQARRGTFLHLGDLARPPQGPAWAVSGRALLREQAGAWSVAAPAPDYLTALAVAPDGASGWAVGRHGTFMQLRAGTWQPVSSPTTLDLTAVAVLLDGTAWAGGGNLSAAGQGLLLHYAAGAWQLYLTGGDH